MKSINGFRSVILLIFLIVFYSNLYSQMRLKDRYYLGAYGLGIYSWDNSVIYFYNQNSPHWSLYNQLNFNLLHQYYPGGLRWDNEQGSLYKIGAFYDDLSPGTLWSNLNNFFSLCNTNNKKVILERHKIDFAAYGQRSTYQVEDNALMITKRPGYGYRYSTVGTDIDDPQYAGVRCKFCDKNVDAPQNYICYGLYENCEQINCPTDAIIFSDTKKNMPYTTPPSVSPDYKWYIKPRMRIPVSEIVNPDKDVVAIEIYDYSGNPIGTPIPIKVKSFFYSDGSYDGKYKEIFFEYQPPPDYPLSVTGEALNSGNLGNNTYASGVDYKVYWYGNCDVYLDYVRVDDEWAHFLFKEPTNPPDPDDRWEFRKKISEQYGEATLFSGTSSFGHFHVDEFHYNNIPCIVEAKRLVKQASGNQSTVNTAC